MTKPIMAVLRGERAAHIPFWYMRQAGRYLPEYRETRAKAGSFLDLCFNSDLAVEVTLQPIRRFKPDAAILFSDILVVPHALGLAVSFREGEGPVVEKVGVDGPLPKFEADLFHARLAPIYRTVAELKRRLAGEVGLIGFAGAPWTVATYMVEGGSSRDFMAVKQWAFAEPESFSRLIDLLTKATIEYLAHQVEAGAEILQVFDSWAGVLPEMAFRAFCTEPMRRITETLKARYPAVPIIGFPRGASALYVDYVRASGVDAVSLDSTVPLSWAAAELQSKVVLQGNLDPQLVVVGGAAMRAEAERILNTLGHGPFIFNLGHGLVPQTPPEHVADLSALIRAWRE
jgi:uroporphyrinogen decarboxylase